MSVAVEETNGRATAEDFNSVLSAAMNRKDAAAEVADVYESADDDADEQGAEPAEDTTAQSAPAPEATTEPEAEQTPADAGAEKSAEGPSQAWLDLARRKNIPDELLSFCHNDDDVLRMISEFGDIAPAHEPKAAPSELDEWRAKLPFKDDEFDASDPIHLWVKEQVDRHNKLVDAIDHLSTGIQGVQASSQLRERQELSKSFDQGVDALGVAAFGKSMSPQRKAIYAAFEDIRKRHPELSHAEQVRRAALSEYPEAFAQKAVDKQLAAQARQNGQQIGGGAAPPPVQRKLNSHEEWLELLRSKIRK